MKYTLPLILLIAGCGMNPMSWTPAPSPLHNNHVQVTHMEAYQWKFDKSRGFKINYHITPEDLNDWKIPQQFEVVFYSSVPDVKPLRIEHRNGEHGAYRAYKMKGKKTKHKKLEFLRRYFTKQLIFRRHNQF